MKDELLRIMEMVREGKVKPEEGAELVEAIFMGKNKSKKSTGKMLVIEVTGDENVKVRVPLKLLGAIKDLIPLAFSISGEKFDDNFVKAILETTSKIEETFEEMDGNIVQVEGEDENVKIYLE